MALQGPSSGGNPGKPHGQNESPRYPGYVPDGSVEYIAENMPWAVKIGHGYESGVRVTAEVSPVEYDDHVRVQAVLRKEVAQSWIAKTKTKIVLIQDTIPDPKQGQEFSILSPYASVLATWMNRRRGEIGITFFCNSYTRSQEDQVAKNRDRGEIVAAMLRSLCYELMDRPFGTLERLREAGYASKQVVQAQEGNLDQLIPLFEELVQHHCTTNKQSVACFIDGVHVLEAWPNAIESFGTAMKSWKRLADQSKFDFKVLITSPVELKGDKWKAVKDHVDTVLDIGERPSKVAKEDIPVLSPLDNPKKRFTAEEVEGRFPGVKPSGQSK